MYKPMDENVFWGIIDSFDWKKQGDDAAVLKPAIQKLMSMPLEDIQHFQEILAQKLYALDGPAYAVNVYLDGYLSPDYFLYVRCCVVANGKDFYNHVLNNPSAMPKDIDFEDLLYLAPDVYNDKLKKDEAYVYLDTKLSYETGSNHELWGDMI